MTQHTSPIELANANVVKRLHETIAELQRDKAELLEVCDLAFRAMQHDNATFKSLEPASTAMRKLQAVLAKHGKES